MTPDSLKELLNAVRQGSSTVDEAVVRLRELPFQDLGCAQVDHHRELRLGVPEMIFGEGKSVEQIVQIVTAMVGKGSNVLVSRLSADSDTLLPADLKSITYGITLMR